MYKLGTHPWQPVTKTWTLLQNVPQYHFNDNTHAHTYRYMYLNTDMLELHQTLTTSVLPNQDGTLCFKTNLQQSHIFLCSTFLKCPLVLFQSLIWWCCCHRGFDCCWCCCCALCPITLCSSFLISQAVPDHLPTHKEVVILPLRSLRLAGWLPLQGHAQFCVWQIVRYQTQENPLVARSLA